jgi:hypothetical protein
VDVLLDIPEWVGRTKADVRRCEGKPDRRTGDPLYLGEVVPHSEREFRVPGFRLCRSG